MSKIFLSHTAPDKTFVHRLAMDLVQRGLPVWFDMWELELGAHLTERISAGISHSDLIVVVLSPASAASEWMARELDWALEVERTQRRTILIPVRLASATVPDVLSDRLYADFSGPYASAFEKLVKNLSARISGDVAADEGAELVPLFLRDALYLNESALTKRLKDMWTSGFGSKVSERQLRVSADAHYEALQLRLAEAADRLTTSSTSHIAATEQVQQRYHEVLGFEEKILPGVADLINVGLSGALPLDEASKACHWFIRLQRVQARASLDLAALQFPELMSDPGYPYERGMFFLMDSNDRASHFFELRSTLHAARLSSRRLNFDSIDRNRMPIIWLPDSQLLNAVKEDQGAVPVAPAQFHSAFGHRWGGTWDIYTVCKYVLPQIRNLVPKGGLFDFDNLILLADYYSNPSQTL